jgi:hypothetical protein
MATDRVRINKLQSNPVADVFFSDTNIGALHDAIRYRVWIETNKEHVIGQQSREQLLFVMRSIFLTESRNIPGEKDAILLQIRELNGHVLNYCVPQIVSELKMYKQYIHDSSTLPVPMERAQLVTSDRKKIVLDTRQLYT